VRFYRAGRSIDPETTRIYIGDYAKTTFKYPVPPIGEQVALRDDGAPERADGAADFAHLQLHVRRWHDPDRVHAGVDERRDRHAQQRPLAANFTGMTVDVGVNVTLANTTLTARATGVPIIKDVSFSAERAFSVLGALNVTKGGASANTAGGIVGSFTGTSGQGSEIAYSFNHDGVSGTTLSGVATFKG